MKDIEKIFEDSTVAMASALKRVAEDEMYDLIGEADVEEDTLDENDLKDTVLEYAMTLETADFYKKIKELGLSRNSKVVRAAEPILK